MIIYSQRDSRWAQLKLGFSQLTMGRFGCTTCCISMLTTYYHPDETPDKTVKTIKYTPGGLVIWNSVSYPNFKFTKRYYFRDNKVIEAYIKDPKKAVILEVQHSHWVVATGKSFFGGYNIADPWFGDRSTTRRYNDDITGFAIFN